MIYISSAGDGSEVINLTRGDDAVITIPMKTDDGNEYDMDATEYLIFSVREKASENSDLLIELESEHGTNDIKIAHEHTMNLPVGFYSAEVQLMKSDGKRVTVWPKLTGGMRTSSQNRKNFCLMSEVVYR